MGNQGTTAVTPMFRVSYPNVFKPRMNDLNGKEEYSVMAIFPKGADLSALKEAAANAMAKKFGPDKTKWPKQYRSPFRDQQDRAKEDEAGNLVMPEGLVAGAIYLNLRTNQKPAVVDQNVQPILEEKDFYAGCYARAKIGAYAYDNKGNKGVSFGLQNIQKMKDGEPLGTRTRPEDDFKPIEDLSNNDPSDIMGAL